MPILVEILLELGRKGVQIFIATQSYNLAKYFEVKRNEIDEVLYHHLHKTENGVQVESNSYFGELKKIQLLVRMQSFWMKSLRRILMTNNGRILGDENNKFKFDFSNLRMSGKWMI